MWHEERIESRNGKQTEQICCKSHHKWRVLKFSNSTIPVAVTEVATKITITLTINSDWFTRKIVDTLIKMTILLIILTDIHTANNQRKINTLEDYKNRFVTQYITYLNTWEALSGTLSPLSTHERLILV